MSDTDDSYDHAGEWSCTHCGTTRNIEGKLDVLVFALGHSCNTDTEQVRQE